MKKRITFLGLLLFAEFAYSQQPATNNNPSLPAQNGTNDRAFWSRAGNTQNNGANNIFGTLWNSPIYTQTNGVQRTVLMGSTPAGSISGSFGLGTNLISPQAKLHVQDFLTTGTDAQGRMFRTDGSSTVENRWMLWTGTNAASNLERFRVATYSNTNANNAYLGTVQNGWLNFRTDNLNRTKLNGTYTNATQYLFNGFSAGNTINTLNTSGYFLISNQHTNLYNNFGAYSMLHLNNARDTSANGPIPAAFGFRPWMKTGITFTDNSDLSYIGIRSIDGTSDRTETAIVVSDNYGPSGGLVGPDDIVFRFTTDGGTNATTYSNDVRNPTDVDGTHLARFTSYGLMGLGNTFGVAGNLTPANLYVRPQSLFHMSYDRQASQFSNPYPNAQLNEAFGFMQITYRRPNGVLLNITGEGETETDGLRFGIDNNVFQPVGTDTSTRHLNAYLRWQEASSFIIQTEDNITPNIEQNERLRVTSIGALKKNHKEQYIGLQNVNTATRISISENGANPLTKPLSLLHLGYDYGGWNQTVGEIKNGYREWMDLGILTSTSRDHVWIGLKPRDSLVNTINSSNEKLDAVIAWGTEGSDTVNAGPDLMRFIFTSDSLFSINDSPQSRTYQGLEVMRLYPHFDQQFYTSYNANGIPTDSINKYGRVGIGDFTVNGLNEQPTHKLDVDGNGRFRHLPDSIYIADSLVQKIVMVDEDGVLRWKSFVPSEFGTYCADTVNGKLDDNKKVVLNNHNLYFTNHPDSMSFDDNKVGVGYDCGTLMPGKLSVYQKFDTTVSQLTIAGHFLNKDISNTLSPIFFTGVYGEASGLQNPNYKTVNRGGAFYARNAQVNFGLEAYATQGDTTYIGFQNIGARVEGSKGASASGLVAQGRNASSINVGVSGRGTSVNTTISAPSTSENIGGQFIGDYSANNNFGVKGIASYGVNAYGIYGNASSATGINRAGYFVGIVEGTAGGVFTSDSMFKANVNPMGSTLKLLNGMRPSTYTMKSTDFPRFNFDNHTQYGFIAQNLETVFPQLVYQSELPAEYDSTGVEIHPAVPYKSVNYNGIIAINTSAIIELNQKVDRATLSDESIKTNVQDLSGSLDKVLDMRGVSYDWDATVRPDLNLDSSNHVGFIAQEIEAIDPRLTFLGDDSLLHVEYDKVVPILAEAIQELNSTVVSKDSIIDVLVNQNENLNDRLTALENCLSALLPTLCQMNQQAIQANTPQAQEQLRKDIAVTLTNRSTIILDQNVPNPFAEQTVINFSIPETVKKAQIHFYNQEGRIIQTVDVFERGLGSVTVFGADLSSGVYTYTLVADGQIVATKKMMKM